MNSSTSLTLSASTVTVSMMRWSRSTVGRTRRDPDSVGQRRLEPVEQRGPRKGPPVDQIVGLARVDRDGFDLFCVDAGAQLRRRCDRSSAARASSCAACEASSVLLPESYRARDDVEDRGGDDGDREHQQPED